MDDFPPHQLDPVHESVLKLYHVYNALSQTPYERGYGIEAGDKNTYYMRYCCRIDLRLIERHLDWNQEEPTSFISPFDTRESAFKEARRRNVASDRPPKWEIVSPRPCLCCCHLCQQDGGGGCVFLLRARLDVGEDVGWMLRATGW